MAGRHWAPEGGRIAECGADTSVELSTASMSGVVCQKCTKLVAQKIRALHPDLFWPIGVVKRNAVP